MKKALSIIIILLSCLQLTSASDWEQLYDAWAKSDPQAAAKAKPLADQLKKQQEKQFKDNIDKTFKSQFEAVFGSELKPSEAYDFMKVVEATAAGDMEAAMKEGGSFLIGKYVPILGTYISWVQGTYKTIKAIEKWWVSDLYRSDAYSNALMIIDEQKRAEDPYVPSYLFKFDFSKPENAPIEAIYHKMQQREKWMFNQWQTKDEEHFRAVQILGGGTWPSKFRSALGKVPDNQEIFNHFLHLITSPYREDFVATMNVFYIEPIAKKQAMLAKAKFSEAMQRALEEAAKARGQEFKPITNVTMNMEVRGESFVGFYQFTGVPNKTYNAMVYSLHGNSPAQENKFQAQTDGSGSYSGNFTFKGIAGNQDCQYIFKVQDQDGRVYGDGKTVKRASQQQMEENRVAWDNHWSNVVGPDITDLIGRLQKLLEEGGAEFEHAMNTHPLNSETTKKDEYKNALYAQLESLAAEQKSDQSSMSEEEFAQKYHQGGAWMDNYDALANAYHEAKQDYANTLERFKAWYNDNPYRDRQVKLYETIQKIPEIFNNNDVETALRLILKEPFIDEVGMRDVLMDDLTKVEEGNQKAGH